MAKLLSEQPFAEEQLQAWKIEHGRVYTITMPETEEEEELLAEATAELQKAEALPEKDEIGNTLEAETELKEKAVQAAKEKLAQVKYINGYFRKPTISELGMVESKGKIAASVVIYNTCLLGGHPLFDKDESVKLSAMEQFGSIITKRTATIKKN